MSEPTHPDSFAPEPVPDDSPAEGQSDTAEGADLVQQGHDDAAAEPDSAEPADTADPMEPEESDSVTHPADSAPSASSAESAESALSPASTSSEESAEGSAEHAADEPDPEADTSSDEADPEVGGTSTPHEQIVAEGPNEADAADDRQDGPTQEPLAEPPARTGIAPIVNAPSGPDEGLNGFLDSVDQWAKDWWAMYRIRRARQKVLAARAAEEQPAEPASDDAEAPAPTAPAQSAPGGHRARHTSSTPRPQSRPGDSSRVGLPKPPPAEQRPADQLFTGSIPTVAENSESPAADAPPAVDESDQTTVLPAYRGDEPAAPAASDQRPELDEQRRRTVITQKATAIEKATSESTPAPYGGSGHIGAGSTQYFYEPADDEEDLYTYIPPYSLPSRDADPEPTRWDLARRMFVSLGALAAAVSTVWMFGWFSPGPENPAILTQNGLQEAYADGWFSGELALLSPDHNWYWIWPLITLVLVVHAIYQWTASQRSTPRQQRTGWLVGTATCLMLVLTAALHGGLFTLAAISAAAIAVVLTQAVRQFNLYTARSETERRLTDDVIGLFFGFGLIQAMSTLSVWLTQQGWNVPGIPAAFWALAGLLLFIWTAAFYSMTERGRITIALGLAWGLFWLVFPRILGEVTSVWVALGAALGAFIVILCTQSRRYRINHAERRAAMGRPLEDII